MSKWYTTLIFFVIYIVYHLVISAVVEYNGDKYYSQRISEGKTNPKVFDISHKYLPDLSKYAYVNDILTISFLAPLLTKETILIEYIGFWIPIFLIRSVTNLVTILPKCKKCPNERNAVIGGCYDKIFSGHFASTYLAVLIYLKYNWISVPVGILMCLANTLTILLSRGHYTIDVIVAFFVTTVIYQNKISISVFT